MRDANRKGGRPRSAQAASVVGDLCGALKPLYTAYQASKLYQALAKAGGIAAWAEKMLLKTVTVGFLNSWVIDQIKVDATPAGKILGSTHDGWAPHEGGAQGGQPMKLGISVRMPPGLGGGEIFAKCGWLAAFGPFQSAIKVPPNGLLADVPVTWTQDPAGASGTCVHVEPSGLSTDRDIASKSLAELGNLGFDDVTASSGESWAVFDPNDEPLMGIGDYCLERGGLTASVDVQEFFGGGLLALSPNVYSLIPAKRVHFSWNVGYHKAKGYKITLSPPAGTLRDDYGYGYDDLTSVTAQVCGSNPYLTPWTVTGTAVNHLGDSVTLSGTVTFAGGEWSPVETAYRDGIVWQLDMRLVNDNLSHMELRGTYSRTGTATAKIEENTACGG
jgi:hypothetical protein